jgi:hypothetical protein
MVDLKKKGGRDSTFIISCLPKKGLIKLDHFPYKSFFFVMF